MTNMKWGIIVGPQFYLGSINRVICRFLFVAYCRKKTAGEMTGLEIITLLAMASMIGHAVSGDGLWKTIVTLCIFVALLIMVQFFAIKFDLVEKWFMGKATLVIQDVVDLH